MGAALDDAEEKPRPAVGALRALGPGERQPAGLLDLARARPETAGRRRAPSRCPRRSPTGAPSRARASGSASSRPRARGTRRPPRVIRRRDARLMTWKPPESVRIARGQPMNAWSPPARRISSMPGPRHQVVRVGEHDAAVPLLEPVERDALDARRAFRRAGSRASRSRRGWWRGGPGGPTSSGRSRGSRTWRGTRTPG